MEMTWDNFDDHVKGALVQFTINLLGVLIMLAIYFNYVLLKPYFAPFFWAVMWSIPLHSVKQSIVRSVINNLQDSEISWPLLTLNLLLSPIRWFLGPVWFRIPVLFGYYKQFVVFLTPLKDQNSAKEDATSTNNVKEEPPKFKEVRKYKSMPGTHFAEDRGHINLEDAQGNKDKAANLKVSDNNNKKTHDERTPEKGHINWDSLLEATNKKRRLNKSKGKRKRKKKNSDVYFSLLFRALVLYWMVSFLGFGGLAFNAIVVLLCCLVLAVCHILFSVTHAVLKFYVPWYLIGRSLSIMAHTFVTFLSKFSLLAKIASMVRISFILTIMIASSIVVLVIDIVHYIQRKLKQILLNNIHSIVAILIVVVFVNALIATAGIFVFKVGEEANELSSTALDTSYYYFNHTILNNELINEGMKEKAGVFVNNGTQALFSWVDSKVQESFPGTNATKLYSDIAYAFKFLYQKFTTNNTSPHADILKSLPATNSLVESFATGNFSTITSASCERAFKEVRTVVALNFWKIFERNETGTLQNYAVSVGQAMMNSSISFVSVLGVGFFGVVNGVLFAFGLMFECLLFITFLYYLLASKRSCLEIINGLLAFVKGDKLLESIDTSIKAVFESSIKMYIFHVVFTWLTFSIYQIDFVYINAFIAGLIAILPFVPPWVICIPPVFQLWMKGQTSESLTLFLLHYATVWTVDDAIYSEIPASHPLIAGLSIVLGIYAFNIYGILLGPVLACVPVIVYHFLRSQFGLKRITSQDSFMLNRSL